jgi:hypothetical protein
MDQGSSRPLPEDPTDIDAALRLLQQLSANLDAPATPPAPPPAAPAIDSLDGLDEFYELFDRDLDGFGSAAEPASLSNPAPSPVASPAPSAAIELDTGSMTGQAVGFGGLEASGSFDPTDGWDLLEDRSVQPQPVVADRPISPSPTPIDPADQINSLDDLFEDLPPLDSGAAISSPVAAPVPGATVPPVPVAVEEDQLFLTDDDRYIPAPPEENLLPSSDRREAPHQEFWLDDLTMNRLSQDLSSLESANLESASLELPFEFLEEATAPLDRALSKSLESAVSHEFEMTFTDPELPSTPQPATGDTATDVEVGQFTASPVPDSETIPAPEVGRSSLSSTPPDLAPAPALPMVDRAGDFSLDDLDDLFGAEALSDPVSATPVSVSDAFAFTLEGMDDLFADTPTPTTTSIPPPDSSPPTIDEPLGFTLEGMDDLFGDLPAPQSPPPVRENSDGESSEKK